MVKLLTLAVSYNQQVFDPKIRQQVDVICFYNGFSFVPSQINYTGHQKSISLLESKLFTK